MKTSSSTSAINKAAMTVQVALSRVCPSGRATGSAEAGRSSLANDSEGSGGRGLSGGLLADTLRYYPGRWLCIQQPRLFGPSTRPR